MGMGRAAGQLCHPKEMKASTGTVARTVRANRRTRIGERDESGPPGRRLSQQRPLGICPASRVSPADYGCFRIQADEPNRKPHDRSRVDTKAPG
jgi:hypothetical protein